MARTTRSSVAALAAAASLLAGCGSNDDTPRPEPTFNADLDAQFAGPQGCVPNPRPAPTASVPFRVGDSPREQAVVISPDPSWERKHGASSTDVISATATLRSASVRPAIFPFSPGEVATNPRVPGLTTDRAGDRFVIVRYELRNRGRYVTTPGQISGHLLVGAGGRWFAPVVGCRFSEADSVEDLVTEQVGAAGPGTAVKPGASAPVAAVYVVSRGAASLRWAASPSYARAARLRPTSTYAG